MCCSRSHECAGPTRLANGARALHGRALIVTGTNSNTVLLFCKFARLRYNGYSHSTGDICG
eukprot:302948-Rhodomonas_salina.1